MGNPHNHSFSPDLSPKHHFRNMKLLFLPLRYPTDIAPRPTAPVLSLEAAVQYESVSGGLQSTRSSHWTQEKATSKLSCCRLIDPKMLPRNLEDCYDVPSTSQGCFCVHRFLERFWKGAQTMRPGAPSCWSSPGLGSFLLRHVDMVSA